MKSLPVGCVGAGFIAGLQRLYANARGSHDAVSVGGVIYVLRGWLGSDPPR